MAKKQKIDLSPQPEGQKIELPEALRALLGQGAEELEAEEAQPLTKSAKPKFQKLKISLDRKQRKGKEVTLIEGFEGSDEELEALAKRLRNSCGVGGSAKEGQIILQGNLKDKASELLKTWGITK